MSETTQTPGPDAQGDPRVAATRDYWTSLGFDAAAFDSAISGQPEAAPAKSLLDPPAALGGKLSDDAYAAAVADLRAAGVSENAIKTALAQDGRTVPDDDRSIEQRAHDEAWGMGRDYQPEDYHIAYGTAGAAAARSDLAGLAQIDGEARAWCAQLNFDPQTGAGIVETALAASRHWAGLSEPQRASYALEQRAQLARVVGASRVAEYEKLATHSLKFTDAGKLPFTQRLIDGGAFKSAEVIVALAHHGERISEWAGRIPPDPKP